MFSFLSCWKLICEKVWLIYYFYTRICLYFTCIQIMQLCKMYVKRDVFKVLQIHSLPKCVSTFKPENKTYYYTYHLHIKIFMHYIYYNHLFTDKLKKQIRQEIILIPFNNKNAKHSLSFFAHRKDTGKFKGIKNEYRKFIFYRFYRSVFFFKF